MRIARYRLAGSNSPGAIHWGVQRDDGDFDRLAAAPFKAIVRAGVRDPQPSTRLLAPYESGRVFGVGLNYIAHAKEARMELPVIPMLFMKPETALIGPDEPIIYPREGGRVDYECELTVVIGRGGRRIPESEAAAHILGYTCGNDVSQRPIQRAEMKMGSLLIGKAFDTFCPIGPMIVTGLDPGRLDIQTRLNGKIHQKSNTSDLLFSVPKLVSYLSQAVTLLPGDLILTGTPAGIGPMLPGDVVEIEIEGIGILRNPIVAEAS